MSPPSLGLRFTKKSHTNKRHNIIFNAISLSLAICAKTVVKDQDECEWNLVLTKDRDTDIEDKFNPKVLGKIKMNVSGILSYIEDKFDPKKTWKDQEECEWNLVLTRDRDTDI